jgi:hypothetical protein
MTRAFPLPRVPESERERHELSRRVAALRTELQAPTLKLHHELGEALVVLRALDDGKDGGAS